MKINKLTSALVALGCLSLAGVAQAAPSTIYLTGSTAARQFVFDCLTNSGAVFTNASGGSILSANNVSSKNLFTIEGTCTNGGITQDVIVNCNFTGSEAGIATVAGAPLTQVLPLNPNSSTFAYPLPGTGSALQYLTAPSYNTTNTTYAGGADVAMADTSQAVSQTPYASYPALDYGVVGIVPFTFLKGYEQTPDATYGRFNNVTLEAFNQLATGGFSYNASHFTGNIADTNEPVALFGRNKGSGTRANTVVNMQIGVSTPILQAVWTTNGTLNEVYPTATPGTLTFNGDYAAGQTPVSCGNDGYDGGSGVVASLEVDGTGLGGVCIGYAGISDAKGSLAYSTSPGGPTVALQFNGVYESDTNVINGTYTFWGQEHVLGKPSPSAATAAFIAALKAGIAKQLITENAGLATNDISVNHSQSYLIPTSRMQVTRGHAPNGQDTGFPVQGTF